jgi:hypothetical protein
MWQYLEQLDHQRYSRIKEPAVVEGADLEKRHLEKFSSTRLTARYF